MKKFVILLAVLYLRDNHNMRKPSRPTATHALVSDKKYNFKCVGFYCVWIPLKVNLRKNI
jgi:hypothetical protein